MRRNAGQLSREKRPRRIHETVEDTILTVIWLRTKDMNSDIRRPEIIQELPVIPDTIPWHSKRESEERGRLGVKESWKNHLKGIKGKWGKEYEVIKSIKAIAKTKTKKPGVTQKYIEEMEDKKKGKNGKSDKWRRKYRQVNTELKWDTERTRE